MNIIENLHFTSDKPAVLPILKTEKLNLLAIGLVQDQLLKKHKAAIPTLLTVLQGAIEFRIGGEVLHFRQFDTYHIPVNAEHEVRGLEATNVFTLTQEK
ncbi:hypothetical protein [Telluribacter sp.]|jgi:quercetin dioxygenase-like cupin family protein|uniref:hypothetical protein n=1 Tax=Telluribacter sp. TaxID=1978767 RepID=UPI002E125559|nr:hypothetical protein [Telluribacter sp.]